MLYIFLFKGGSIVFRFFAGFRAVEMFGTVHGILQHSGKPMCLFFQAIVTTY